MAQQTTHSDRNAKPKKDAKYFAVLGKAFWNIVEHYSFTQKEQAILLGIKYNRDRLNKYKADRAIPDDPDKHLRVAQLIGIHKNLRILFSHNRDVVYRWMKTQRELFAGKSAMEYIAEDPMTSLPRLASVRRLLDQIRVGA